MKGDGYVEYTENAINVLESRFQLKRMMLDAFQTCYRDIENGIRSSELLKNIRFKPIANENAFVVLDITVRITLELLLEELHKNAINPKEAKQADVDIAVYQIILQQLDF